MTTYEQSGVNIDLGDKCSAIAYKAATKTFIGRKGMIGSALLDEGGFSGALDMGDYYLVQNDDGVGTKMAIAEKIEKYDTIGYDLLAMVTDDAICLGAEPISVSNTIDVNKVDEKKIAALMDSLKNAALEHKVVIPGGEIAEVGDLVKGYIWNATAIGIVEKHKLITGENVKVGDKIIGLKSVGFRSNGFSLVRHVLNEHLGENWEFEKYDESFTWGEKTLIPSKIYTSAVMEMHGRYKEKPKVELKGVVHVTGGGIPGNIVRVLKKSGLSATLNNLPEPHEVMKKLIKMGNIPKEDAYRTWNMGVGMILISNDVEKIQEICKKYKVESLVIGEVTEGKLIMDI
jgi:phosphoribosylformylglycinamidine cyclo-ligase